MTRKVWSIMTILFLGIVYSCSEQDVKDANQDAREVEVLKLSPEMMKVRDYVPPFAVMAHRGTTYWAPEETEAAFRWGREMGADYLEADLQSSKDGVLLALHDGDLTRTTNIEEVYGEEVPKGRKDYYIRIGYSEKEAEEKVAKDKASFMPYTPLFYTYEELMALDAGTWFNEKNLERARAGFKTKKQYISTLEDLIAFSKGKVIKRDADGKRVFKMGKKTGETLKNSYLGESDIVKYEFEYEADPVDSGNRPGIYIEFKEPWTGPKKLVDMVYNELDRLDMNIITKPSTDKDFYKDGKVNVGNTNGKVILQTFSLSSLVGVEKKFMGKVPMCFLLWKGTGDATSMVDDSPEGYASYINQGVEHKAHIIGPSIAGKPNNYPELNEPWQDYLIKKAGMLNHPYSFDTKDQMRKYFGEWNYGNKGGDLFNPPYLNGMFTNRSGMTLQYFIDKDKRPAPAPQVVPDPEKVLENLGYAK